MANSGRVIPGAGSPLSLTLVSGAVAANTDPGTAANKIVEVTVAGNPQSVTVQTNVGAVAGANAAGSVAIATLDGIDYGYASVTADTTVIIADEVAEAAMSGSYGCWRSEVLGGPAAGGEVQELRLGANIYQYPAIAGDNGGSVTNGLVAAAAADPNYTVFRNSNNLLIRAKTRGTAPDAPIFIPDGVVFTSNDTVLVTKVAGQTMWNVTDDGASNVTAELTIDGDPGVHTAAGSATNITGTITFSLPESIHGYDADIAIVDDGTNVYSYTIQPGDAVDDAADGLATLMNGVDGYVASHLLGVETVTRTDFTNFVLAGSVTSTNPASTLSVTPATTQALVPPMAATNGVSITASKAQTGTVELALLAGTSYDAEVWTYDQNVSLWFQDAAFATKTIAANVVYSVPMNGSRMYVYVSNFVGGAIASVYLNTKG